ncbi:MAG: hypothetical protein WD851_07410 [Pirellulales bacterium]
MNQQRYTHRTANPARGGIATLEFVMALPTLLLLMVGLTWLGYSVIGQTEVIIEARNKAWAKRFDNAADKPLIFPIDLLVADNPLYPKAKDFVTAKASKKVNVSKIFSRVPGPESSHTILAGSWDHQAMKFDKRVNWNLHGIAVVNATTGKVQGALASVDNFGSKLQDLAGQALADAASDLVSKGAGGGGGNIENLGSAPKGDSTAADDATAQTQQQKNDTKVQLTAEKNRIEGEIRQADREIEALREKQNKNSETVDEAVDKVLEAAQVKRQIELLEYTKERLNSDLNDVKAELKATG